LLGGVALTVAAANKGRYPYARVLRVCTDYASETPTARDFVLFVQSGHGQLDRRAGRVSVQVELQHRRVAASVRCAAPGRSGLTFMRAVEFLRGQPACWLLAAVLAAPAALAHDQPSPAPNSGLTATGSVLAASEATNQVSAVPALASLAVPKPAPTDPKDLPAAFSKPAPASIADFKAMERHVEALTARVSPAVVAVEVGTGSGSGVIITADGLVLSAGHVCGAPGRRVRFTFPDGKTARGKTVGLNRENDTGLMQITDRGPWPHAEMGDLTQAHVGDWVLALGHPGGFDLRRSLVVRLGRIIMMDPEALQTDCTISPGDSGGPLFDMYGRVIGVHSAISTSPAENYHVAVTAFYDGWDQLVGAPASSNPPVRLRAYVGATGTDDVDGCRLTVVDEDGPAAKAGLKVGDLVVKVDGRDIKRYAFFQRWVAEAEPGETLNLEVKRGDKVLSLEVKLAAPGSKSP
jgi:serine protease Do